MRIKTVPAALAAVALLVTGALTGCSVDRSGQDKDKDKPTIRIAYQTFPSGDLIVKNNRWLEEALPDYNIKWTKFRLRCRRQHRVHRQTGRFRRARLQPGGPRPVRAAEHPLQRRLHPRRRRRQRSIGGAQWHRHRVDSRPRGKRVATAFASTAHYSLLAALAANGLSAKDVQLIDLQPQASLAAWDRGDVDAVYTWLPTLDLLRKNGKTLITSRELAAQGKPTLDLATVSDSFAKDHPEVVDIWRQQQARALRTIKDDPDAAAKAVAAEIGLSPADVAQQLKQAVFLTPQQVASPEWLGTEGAPGNLAVNLQSASQFLADQKQIPAPAPLKTFQDAIYVRGLPNAITQ